MLLINNIKKFLFPFYKKKEIKQIFQILNANGNNNAMLVGGCVRNFLNNQKIYDIDIATIFTPDEIVDKFSSSDYKIIKTGIEHGTITLSKEGKNFEITTLRKDITTDGRHAKVSYSTDWEVDSERRDFTINAIYLDQRGKIFDPQNGKKDLKDKKIKFIGDPQKRIQEDYLRIIRYLRFSLQYKDFHKDDETIKIIKKNLNGVLKLSKERIFMELKKIINLENVTDVFLNKEINEIFEMIFPEFKYLGRIKGLDKEIYKKFLKNDKNLFLSLLLVGDTDNHIYFGHKYKTSNQLKDYLNFINQNFIKAQKNKNFFKKDIKKNIYYDGKDKFLSFAKFYFILNYPKKFNKIKSMLDIINSINIPKFPITGKLLLDKGLKSGKKMGDVLKEIEKYWVENNFSIDDEELKNILKKHI